MVLFVSPFPVQKHPLNFKYFKPEITLDQRFYGHYPQLYPVPEGAGPVSFRVAHTMKIMDLVKANQPL